MRVVPTGAARARACAQRLSPALPSEPAELPPAPALRSLCRAIAACALLLAAGALAQSPYVKYRVELDAPPALADSLRSGLELYRWQGYETMTPALLARLMAEAEAEARDILAANGYFGAQTRATLDAAAEPQVVRLAIDPGEPTRVDAVDLRLEGAVDADPALRESLLARLRADWLLPAGAVFTQADWDRAKRTAVAIVSERLYAGARIAASEARVDPERRTATLAIAVDSGPALRFGALRITGPSRHAEERVSNLWTFAAGEPYDREKLERFQRRLALTGYFASAVVEADPATAEDGRVPVRVNVIEASPRRLELSLGYSTDTKFRGSIDWRNNDVFARDWRLRLAANLETVQQSAEAAIDLPERPSGWSDTFGVRAKHTDIENLQTSEVRVGARTTAVDERSRPAFGAAFIAARQEPSGQPSEDVYATFVDYVHTWRATDAILSPRRGWVVQTELGGGVPGLSTRGFGRAIGRIAWFHPFTPANELALRVEAGAGKSQWALAVEGLNLRGLHPPLRETRLAGKIVARRDAATQELEVDLREKDSAIAGRATRAGDAVRIPALRATARGGTLTGDGSVSLAGAKPFALRARFDRFDPAAFGDWPAATLNGEVSASGTLDPAWRADVRVALADSRYRGAPLTGRGTFNVSAAGVRDAGATATIGANRVEAKGSYGRAGDTLAVELDARNLAQLDPRAQGRLVGRTTLGGTTGRPSIAFDVRGAKLRWDGGPLLGTLAAKGALAAGESRPIDVAATGEGMDAVARVEGTWGGARVAGRRRAARESRRLRARARESRAARDRRRSRGARRRRDAGPPGRSRAGPPRLGERAPRHRRTLPRAAGCAAARPGGLGARARHRPAAARGLVDRDDAARERRGPRRARERGPGGRGEPAARARAARGRGEVRGQRTRGDREPAGDRPRRDVGTGIHQRARARCAAERPSDRKRDDAAAPRRAGGHGGDRRRPRGGRLRARRHARRADGVRIDVPQYGIALRDGVLRATLEGDRLLLESLSIRGPEGELTASGTLARGGEGANLAWRAEKLRLFNRPDRRLVVTGAGTAALSQTKLALRGDLRAEEGYIEFATEAQARLGDDVVVVGRTPPPQRARAGALPLDIDMTLDPGPRFRIVGQGLDAVLRGTVRVQTRPDGVVAARGTIDTVNGTLRAYGQRLDIERGRLVFDGPIDNPALDLLALRKNLAVEAGVEVTGTARTPLVRLTSRPPVPDAEKLSWLVLGRARPDPSSADLALLQAAAAQLVSSGEAVPMHRRIIQGIGLDDISVRGAAGGTASGQVVAFGKRVSDRLYVEFEQGLTVATSFVRLTYVLTRTLSVNAQTSQSTSSFGFTFRRSFD